MHCNFANSQLASFYASVTQVNISQNSLKAQHWSKVSIIPNRHSKHKTNMSSKVISTVLVAFAVTFAEARVSGKVISVHRQIWNMSVFQTLNNLFDCRALLAATASHNQAFSSRNRPTWEMTLLSATARITATVSQGPVSWVEVVVLLSLWYRFPL